MKVAIITDTHAGVRGDNVVFDDMMKQFMDTIFLPKIDELGITHVIHLGDIVDRRKIVNIQTATRLRTDFIKPILDRDIALHLILGNHDVSFRDTNKINAPTQLFQHDFPIYDEPYELILDNEKLLLLPWINKENKQKTLDLIEKTDALIAMGHLEIEGFSMHKGGIKSHGLSKSLFDRFDLVLSGHFHHRSCHDNIYYCGSHGEFTWADYDDPRGFHILDIKTKELTFIENPYKMFRKIEYDEDSIPDELYPYKNSYIKVIIKNKTKQSTLDDFIKKLELVNPIDIQVIESHLNLELTESTEAVDESISTIDIFKHHISELDISEKISKRLEETMITLYNKANEAR